MAIELKLLPAERKWCIPHFAALPHAVGDFTESEEFELLGLRWTLTLYPGGAAAVDTGFLAVYLDLKGSNLEATGFYNVILFASDGTCQAPCSTFARKNVREWKSDSPRTFGLKLLSRAEVLRPESKLLDESGTLNLGIHLFLLKHSPHDHRSDLVKHSRRAVDVAFERDMLNLLSSGAFSDVVFKVGTARFKAHRSILTARCPVFQAMFAHEMKESKEGAVDVEGVKPNVFEQMLRFVYTNECDAKTSEQDFAELLVVADRYQIQSLVDLCGEKLAATLSVDDVCERFMLADQSSAAVLKEKCLEYMATDKQRLRAIRATEGYKKLSREQVDAIIAAMIEPDVLPPKRGKRPLAAVGAGGGGSGGGGSRTVDGLG